MIQAFINAGLNRDELMQEVFVETHVNPLNPLTALY